MTRIPQIKSQNLSKFFQKEGFVVTRQVGSHQRLVNPDGRRITIAIHRKPLAPGTLRSILKQANMSREQFLKLYKK